MSMSMMFDFVLFASIIYSFQEHLAAQRKEREKATSELGFKKQLTKEKFEKKKQTSLMEICHGLFYQFYSVDSN
jgi:hypothetical protein